AGPWGSSFSPPMFLSKAYAALAAARPARNGLDHDVSFRVRRGQPAARGASRARDHVDGARTSDAALVRPSGAPARARREPAPRRGGAHRRGARSACGIGLVPGATAVPTVRRNALVRLLGARGWTDGELATRAGLDRTHVNQIKN